MQTAAEATTDARTALEPVEAEQALIGAALVNGDVIERVARHVTADDFHDPVHARIWALCCARQQSGDLVAPSLLAPFLRDDEGLAKLGGPAYLARLAGAAVSIFSAPDYARAIAQAAARRRLIGIAERGIERAKDPATPPETAAAAMEGEMLAFEPPSGAPRDAWIAASVAASMEAVWAAYHGEGTAGVGTGLPSLDDMTGGWRGGRLIVLAGRPGMGKSAVALFFAWAAASRGRGVQFSSLEMSEAEVSARLVSLQTWRLGQPVEYERIMRGTFGEHEGEVVARAAADVAELPIRISGPLIRDLGGIAAAAKRSRNLMAARGLTLDLIVLDYLGLIRPPRERQSKVHEVGDVTAGLKLMARTLDTPVIVLAQLNRGVEQREDKRPNISDLRDSGDIEQDADQILFPYRHEYYLAREKPQNGSPADMADWEAEMAKHRDLMEIDVAKNRHGRTGRVRCVCMIRANAIAEIAL
jgi:replicative DNA helicase